MTDNLVESNRSLAPTCILVCQNRTCRKQGAADVLAAFRELDRSDIGFEGCGCLGNCGNGPMALVLPARIWYYRVHPRDVPTIVAAVAPAASN
jgi:(2Fe-2S) ferredoxin